jgi:hypothetical protein
MISMAAANRHPDPCRGRFDNEGTIVVLLLPRERSSVSVPNYRKSLPISFIGKEKRERRELMRCDDSSTAVKNNVNNLCAQLRLLKGVQ